MRFSRSGGIDGPPRRLEARDIKEHLMDAALESTMLEGRGH